MASATIGAAGDYATYAAFESGQTAGDKGTFLDATHTETITMAKPFEMNGNIANRGVTLQAAGSGTTLFAGGSSGGTKLINLTFNGQGLNAFNLRIGSVVKVINCKIMGTTNNDSFASLHAPTGAMIINCDITGNNGNASRMGLNVSAGIAINVSVSDCGRGVVANATSQLAYMLSANNSGNDFSGTAFADWASVSEDNTAGLGSNVSLAVTGFDPDDWTDKTSILTIRDAVKDVTLAKIADSNPDQCAAEDAFGNVRRTGGDTFAGNHDPDPAAGATKPGKPAIVSFTPSSGQVILDLTVATAGDEMFVVFRKDNEEPWSAENPTFSRTNNGTVTVTGLVNEQRYEFGVYAKETVDNLTSNWDTGFSIPTALAGVANRPLSMYKVAVRDFFLNSTNLLDWIQTVDGSGSTSGRVILGHAGVSAFSDVKTSGPKVFIGARTLAMVNDGSEKTFTATMEINAEIVWSMNPKDNATFSAEENFIDLLLDEAADLGFGLDSSLSGSIESVSIPNIEGKNQTPGQLPNERRTNMEFIIEYSMPK